MNIKVKKTALCFLGLAALMLIAGAAAAGQLESAKGIGPGACTVPIPLFCGGGGSASLGSPDCVESPGIWVRFWTIQGIAGQEVTIDVSSSDFDTVLDLLNPDGVIVASNDDSGGGTDSHIVYTLDSTGPWTAKVSNFPGTGPGSFNISLGCSGGQGPLAAPSNLTATAISETQISLTWQDNSNNEESFVVEEREEGAGFEVIGIVEADDEDVLVAGLRPGMTYTYRIKARNTASDSAYSNEATATTFPSAGGCSPTETSLCLLDGRFRVEVDWRNFETETGLGRVVELGPFAAGDSGLLYFFNPDNWEMLVKMVDACNSPFNSFWVFAAATTNVEYTLRVTDTQTGVVQVWFNPLGSQAPSIVDPSAFLTCP